MPQLMQNQSRYLLFSVDVEPDDPEWKGLLQASPITLNNLAGLGELSSRLHALGVHSTYFTSHSAVQSTRLETVLQKDLAEGRAEVGTHFHPGDTPPFRAAMADIDDNILQIPDFYLHAKFANLHKAITARYGAPKAYRSGSWVLDHRVLDLLKEYQYRVDSSVTPGISWRAKSRPSYLRAPMRVYPLSDRDPSVPGSWNQSQPLVEIPVSIWSPYQWTGKRSGRFLGDILTMPLSAGKSWPIRLVRALRPKPPQWLRPAFVDAQDMEKTAILLEQDGAEYLHIMCHSNELWPGASPYCAHRDQLDSFYKRMERILKFALDRGYIPVTLSEYGNRVLVNHRKSLSQSPEIF